jgi:hypothetical protein
MLCIFECIFVVTTHFIVKISYYYYYHYYFYYCILQRDDNEWIVLLFLAPYEKFNYNYEKNDNLEWNFGLLYYYVATAFIYLFIYLFIYSIINNNNNNISSLFNI